MIRPPDDVGMGKGVCHWERNNCWRFFLYTVSLYGTSETSIFSTPLWASSLAVAFPMPVLAPVITTVFPLMVALLGHRPPVMWFLWEEWNKVQYRLNHCPISTSRPGVVDFSQFLSYLLWTTNNCGLLYLSVLHNSPQTSIQPLISLMHLFRKMFSGTLESSCYGSTSLLFLSNILISISPLKAKLLEIGAAYMFSWTLAEFGPALWSGCTADGLYSSTVITAHFH